MNPEETNTFAQTPITPVDVVPEATIQTPPVQKTPWYKNPHYLIAIIIAVGVLGGALAYLHSIAYFSGGVVATVNDEKISQKKLEKSINYLTVLAEQQGVDVTVPEVRDQISSDAMKTVIDNTLLLLAAKEAGITATKERIEEEYAKIITQAGGEEELAKQLALFQITDKDLRRDIRDGIKVDSYLESATDIEIITVSEAEIMEFLAQIKTQVDPTQLPPIEELRPQIEAEVMRQKQQKIYAEHMEILRTSALIEIKI